VCYNVTYTKRKVEKLAKHKGIAKSDVPLFPEAYWSSGFGNPQIPVITNNSQGKIQMLPWGLIPAWTKNSKDAILSQRKYLNARDDNVFSSGVWRELMKSKRCIICLHGFYEYHHVDKNTKIPYLVTLKDDQPMIMAGLWDHWLDKEHNIERTTITMVTTQANDQMKQIHNNPDVLKRGGARMPLILPLPLIEKWLNINVVEKADQEELQTIIAPYPAEEMDFKTVGQLAGKTGIGNTPNAWKEIDWPIIGLPQIN
jgi:putative SOS response-associated peptidase YedK